MDIRGGEVRLTTTDGDRTVQALFASGIPIRDLEVSGASIEEAFLALTSDPAPRQGGNPMTTSTNTMRSPVLSGTFTALAAFVSLEIRRALRNRRYVMLAIGFPVVFYLLYTGVLGRGHRRSQCPGRRARLAHVLHGLDGELRRARRGTRWRDRHRAGARFWLDTPTCG